MPRPAPAAQRTLDVLDFLAAHPLEEYTLTELSREIGANGASLHAVLAVMEDSGFVVRHRSHKTYRLGPATMAIGHAALERFPVLDVAREEMRLLADDTGAESRAAAPIGDDLVMVARVGRPNPDRPMARVGERLALVPPLGLCFVAWADDKIVRQWLNRRLPGVYDDLSEGALLSLLDSVRALYYTVGLASENTPAPRPVSSVNGDPRRLDVETDGLYEVAHIAAPVFDHQGNTSLVITLESFPKRLSGEQILEIGTRLSSSARVVSRLSGGSVP